MRIGINGSGLLAKPDLSQMVADVQRAEASGLANYWLAQTGLVDALTVFAVAGGSTSSIDLGTAVVPTWPRHPQALAAQALTTQAATGSRLILGIGLAHQMSVEGSWKMKWEKPIRHMLDYLGVLEELLATGKSSYEGDVWSFVGESAMPTDDISNAASNAGRPAPAVVCSLPVWVTDRSDEARAIVAKTLTIYGQLPSYRAMLDIEGVDGPADISLIGSEEEVREGLAEIAAAGATDFTAVVQGFDDDERERAWSVLSAAAPGSSGNAS